MPPKRQKFENSDDSHSDNDEEKPLVVVVKSGDLTAEEAEAEQNRLEEGMYVSELRKKFCLSYATNGAKLLFL